MDQRILTQQFQEAWLRMDTSAMSGFMADTLRFSSVATFGSFDNKQEFLRQAERIFINLKESGAITISGNLRRKTGFQLTYQYESLVPVSHYIIGSTGFGIISCLELRVISLETTIKLKFNRQLIREMQIIQEKKVECRKTA